MSVRSVLMCHAPIVIPTIGGERAEQCQRTTKAMARAAEFLIHDPAPEAIVVLSPHAPRLPGRFALTANEQIRGDFGQFGHPDVAIRLPGAPELHDACLGVAKDALARSQPIHLLDHGSMVPLDFLQKAGWSGPTLVVGFPYQATNQQCRDFGEALQETAEQLQIRLGICASGDMSHRLRPDGPAGFHPQGQQFDDHVVSSLESGDLRAAVEPDSDVRAVAAEDVINSLEVAAAAGEFAGDQVEIYAYEGPFGVGYLEAALYDWR